jgi:hypothetical protein
MESEELHKRATDLAYQASNVAAGGALSIMNSGPQLLMDMAALIVDMAESIDAMKPYADED